MMYFLSIGDSIVDAFRTVMYVLCELIYSLMVFFFKVFQALGRAQILDETITKTLFGRISLIIGIFMTFRLTFAFIQYIINPDTLADKKKRRWKYYSKNSSSSSIARKQQLYLSICI